MLNDYVVLRQYVNPSIAFIIKAFLNSNNIRVVITDHWIDLDVSVIDSGTTLLVHKDDYKKALTLLSKYETENYQELFQENEEDVIDNPDVLEQAEQTVREVTIQEFYSPDNVQKSLDESEINQDENINEEFENVKIQGDNESNFERDENSFGNYIKCPRCESIDLTQLNVVKLRFVFILCILPLLIWGFLQCADLIPSEFDDSKAIILIFCFVVFVIFFRMSMSRKYRCNNCYHIWKMK